MLAYRVYVVDRDGHVKDVPRVIECKDDEEAILRAKQLLDGHPIEIWEGARVVAKLAPE